MNILYLLFVCIQAKRIIKNIEFGSCRNCVHYKPNYWKDDFTSPLNKCTFFGEKNVVTDEITYSYADSCRSDETKCGLEGRFFEREDNLKWKIAKHRIFRPVNIFALPFIISVLRLIFIHRLLQL